MNEIFGNPPVFPYKVSRLTLSQPIDYNRSCNCFSTIMTEIINPFWEHVPRDITWLINLRRPWEECSDNLKIIQYHLLKWPFFMHITMTKQPLCQLENGVHSENGMLLLNEGSWDLLFEGWSGSTHRFYQPLISGLTVTFKNHQHAPPFTNEIHSPHL